MKVNELSTGNFDAAIKFGNTVVCFFDPRAGADLSMDNVIAEAATEDSAAAYYKVNAFRYPALASRYGIDSLPCTLYFSGGRLMRRSTGVIGKEELVSNVIR